MRRVGWFMVVAMICGCGDHGKGAASTAKHERAQRPDGGSKQARPTKLTTLRRMWGAAPDDIWAVGDAGAVVHFDGRSWSKVSSGTTTDLTGIAGHARGDAWIVGKQGTLLRINGTRCAAADSSVDGGATNIPGGVDFLDVWVAPDGTTWLVGGKSEDSPVALVGRSEKGRWSFDQDDGQPLTAVWGNGPDDVWARGVDSILHWNGRYLIAHTKEKPPARRGMHGFAGGWRLGKDHMLNHADLPSLPAEGDKKKYRVYDFWAFGTDDVWATTTAGMVHFDGKTWGAPAAFDR